MDCLGAVIRGVRVGVADVASELVNFYKVWQW
jgi:hypothetical protein